MKKYLLAFIPISFLVAGPVIAPLVDYDTKDLIIAEKEVKKKVILPPVAPVVVKTPGVRVVEKRYPGYELDGLIGRNFSDDDSVIKDATTAGIRLNKYITEDFAIQIGYDRVFDANYKRALANKRHASRSIPVCGIPPCGDETDNAGGDTDNNDNSSQDNNGGGENQNDSGSNTNDNPTDNSVSSLGVKKRTKSTDIDRFYLNALKEIPISNSDFIPYAFAGIGYEHVTDKSQGIESQGFFNAGGGLKYALDNKLRVVSEAKVIKKFKDKNLDIVAMVGLGVLFGQKTVAIEKSQKVSENILPVVEVAKTPTTPQESNQSRQIDTIVENAPEEKQIVLSEKKFDDFDNIVATNLKTDKIDNKNKSVYFIQVAVVTKEKSLDNYLAKIRDNDLSYEIKPVSITNPFARRVLIGPYSSKLDAKLDMPIVKDEIEKKAFIKSFKR